MARLSSLRVDSISLMTSWAVARISCAVCWKSLAVPAIISPTVPIARSCWSRRDLAIAEICAADEFSSLASSFSRLPATVDACLPTSWLISAERASMLVNEPSMRLV